MLETQKTFDQNFTYPSFTIVIEWDRIFQSDYIWRAQLMLQRLCEQILQIFKEKSNNEILIIYDPYKIDGSEIEKFVMKYLVPCINILKIRIQQAPGLSYYEVKNFAAKISSTELMLFVDSDIVPDDRWLVEMLKAFEQTEVDIVSGNTYIGLHNIIAKVLALITFQPLPDIDHMYERNHFYGQNVAFRRKILLSHPFPKLNTFHGHADVLINELLNNDIKIYRQPKCTADHPMPITLREFVTWGLVQGLVWPTKRKAIRIRDKNKIKNNNPATFRQTISRTRKRIHYVGLSPKVVIGACGILPAHFFLNFVGIIITVFWPNHFNYMIRKKWRMWI